MVRYEFCNGRLYVYQDGRIIGEVSDRDETLEDLDDIVMSCE